jgi:hypothetical protein
LLAALLLVKPPALTDTGRLANCTGLFLLPVLPETLADRRFVPNPDKIASRRANDSENCDSIFSNCNSSPATFEAVSDIREREVSSGLSRLIGAKVTDCVGVDKKVLIVPAEFFPFFFNELLVLRKVDMESVSLWNPKDIPLFGGTSNCLLEVDSNPAVLLVRS